MGSDFLDLLTVGIGSLADLGILFLSETDHEAAEDSSVEGLNVNKGFDEGLPLADEGAKLVTGHVHAVERSSAGRTFNIFNLEFDLSPGHIVRVVLKISQGDFDDTSLDEFSGDTGTGGLGDTGLTERLGIERGRSLEIEPVLSGHGVNNFFLASFLRLTLAFSDGHAVRFIKTLLI
jgi:hypothetical protein